MAYLIEKNKLGVVTRFWEVCKTRRILIGRSYDVCEVVLNDINISRSHASLQYIQPNHVILTDLQTPNGTTCDGTDVTQPLTLNLKQTHILQFAKSTHTYTLQHEKPLSCGDAVNSHKVEKNVSAKEELSGKALVSDFERSNTKAVDTYISNPTEGVSTESKFNTQTKGTHISTETLSISKQKTILNTKEEIKHSDLDTNSKASINKEDYHYGSDNKYIKDFFDDNSKESFKKDKSVYNPLEIGEKQLSSSSSQRDNKALLEKGIYKGPEIEEKPSSSSKRDSKPSLENMFERPKMFGEEEKIDESGESINNLTKWQKKKRTFASKWDTPTPNISSLPPHYAYSHPYPQQSASKKCEEQEVKYDEMNKMNNNSQKNIENIPLTYTLQSTSHFSTNNNTSNTDPQLIEKLREEVANRAKQYADQNIKTLKEKRKILWGKKDDKTTTTTTLHEPTQTSVIQEDPNQYSHSFKSDIDRKSKFLKLMGYRSTAEPPPKLHANEKDLFPSFDPNRDRELENQYYQGLKRMDGKKTGLGL